MRSLKARYFRIRFACIVLVLLSPVAHAVTLSMPSATTNTTFTISWSGGGAQVNVYESTNGGTNYTLVHSGVGPTGSFSLTRPAGTYTYYGERCTYAPPPNPPYYPYVWTCYPGQPKSISVIVEPATPGAISGPSSDTDGDYTLSWGSSSGATSYTLRRRLNGGSWSTIQNNSSTSRAETDRSNGTWGYIVRACNAAGCSGYTSTKNVSVLLSPNTPGGLTAPSSDNNGSYTVSWNAVSTATSYTLQRRFNGGSWSTIQNTAATSRSESVSPGDYSYRVRACNSSGCSTYSSATSVGVPPATPSAITGPSTDADGAYVLSWGASSGASSYELQRKTASLNWGTIQNNSSTSRSEVVSNPYTWDYRVRACGTGGCSYFTATKSVTVIFPPTAPGGLSAPSSDSDGSYTVSWNSVSSATSYTLQRRLNGGSWGTVQNTSATSRSESGLSGGTYDYRVRACNSSGCSSFTGTVSTVTKPSSAPGGLTAPSTDGDGTYTVSWNSVAGTYAYELQRRTNGVGWSTIQNYPTTNKLESGLTSAEYDYHVRACNVAGCSGYSSAVTVTVPPAVPSAISGPSTDTNGTYEISWGASSSATSYELQRRLDGGSWSTVQDLPSTYRSESELDNGTYDYRVRACNGIGCSSYTGIFTTDVIPYSISYEYDELGRLTKVTRPDTSSSYEYDDADNRVSKETAEEN